MNLFCSNHLKNHAIHNRGYWTKRHFYIASFCDRVFSIFLIEIKVCKVEKLIQYSFSDIWLLSTTRENIEKCLFEFIIWICLWRRYLSLQNRGLYLSKMRK